MGELKQHQPPMTIDEQVENLKSISAIPRFEGLRLFVLV